MNQKALVQRLSEGIAAAIRSVNFCVSGSLPKNDPGINVNGVGQLALPLESAPTTQLVKECKQAPFGKGAQTLIDTRVRNAFELSPKKFSLTNKQWDEAIRATVCSVAEKLGLPGDRLEPQLYKLLLYRAGGMFHPHRDSEKSDRMVASLIVALPSPFKGGELIVRHKDQSERIAFKEAAAGKFPCYAAFYADCEHEVTSVRDGLRLCLAYNLVLRAPERGKLATPDVIDDTANPLNEIAQSISAWVAAVKSQPLVFALDHHYTQRGLSLDLLKGNDRATADLVIAAADLAGCRTCLCQVSRHLMQHADDGRYERDWGDSNSVPKNLELGEVYEDDLNGAEWVDTAGKRLKLPDIGFSTASIVASAPLDQWKPTREEYEGYTGNAGNTLDRWYHRSALCVWHHDSHFDVIAGSDLNFAIEMLQPMVLKLKKTPKKRLELARGECVRLAGAIITHWPKVHQHYYDLKTAAEPIRDGFLRLLAAIDDPDAARQLLKLAAPRDRNLAIDKLVVGMCRKHGVATFADELMALFEMSDEEICVRDFEWLDQLACARLDDPPTVALIAKLARSAAVKFCRTLPPESYSNKDPTHPDLTLRVLIRVLIVSNDDETLEQLVRFVTSQPERFTIEKVQLPAIQRVIAWCVKQNATVHPLVVKWLHMALQALLAATADEPQPPADWQRPAEIACSCKYCQQLNEILADPNAPTGRIRAREDDRSHLLGQIRRHDCDVTHRLERSGSPYTLVFTKTAGSFDRRLKRYTIDSTLLETAIGLLHQCGEEFQQCCIRLDSRMDREALQA